MATKPAKTEQPPGPRYVDYLRLDTVQLAPRNPKGHHAASINRSIDHFGFAELPLMDERTGRLVAGHGRHEQLVAMHADGGDAPDGVKVDPDGAWLMPIIRGWASRSDSDAEAYLIASNQITTKGGWEDRGLAEILEDLQDAQLLELTGFDDDDLEQLLAGLTGDGNGGEGIGSDTDARRSLAERFGVPPFTIFDARQGYWQDRKRSWIALGLRSEMGRSDGMLGGLANAAEIKNGLDDGPDEAWVGGTSIFDPVLCEILIRWYSAPDARVLDPFAGGSVRGLAAARLGRSYLGVDLRPEQVAANEEQATAWATRGLLATGEHIPATQYGPDDLTPVEEHGDYWVKRDDLFRVAGGAGGKARTCLTLARTATGGLVTAGSRQSPQVNIVAGIAATLGIACRVHVPATKGSLTPELVAAQAAGAEIVQHRPGHNTVIIARAREDAKDHGWTEIPFGMECWEAVHATAAQVRNLPADATRLVVPVGSGMSLAGILTGLTETGRAVPVLGVIVGADPTKRLDTYAPPDWRDRVELAESGLDYHQHAPQTTLGPITLDPVYEAKCLPFLQPGDVLWVVGCRETVVDQATAGPMPRWITGDSRHLRDLIPEVDGGFDLMLTCPPYYDLEQYSSDPADLSLCDDYQAFLAGYGECLSAASDRMAPDAFAAITTGAIRDKHGYVLDLPADTTRIMESLGWRLYQDAVLATQSVTAGFRAGRQFAALRKLTRVHQMVAVYHRGDIKPVRAWPPCEAGAIEDTADPDTEAD